MTDKKPLFYNHWSTAFACMVTQGLGMGIFGIYGIFVLPLHEELGIDVAALNLGLALMMVLMGFIGPVVGPMLDRVSIKRIMMTGAVIGLVGLCLMSTASNALTLTLFYSIAVIGIGLYGPLTGNTLIVKTYDRDRARALAIAAIGVSFASMLLPPFAAWLVEGYNWRVAITVLGIICGSIVFTALWFSVPTYPPVTNQVAEDVEEDQQGAAFLKQAPFWVLGLVFAVVFGAATLTTTSYIPHLRTIGFSLMDASVMLAAGGAGGLAGKLTFAWIADRMRHKLVSLLMVLLAMQVFGWILFINSTTQLPLYTAAITLGFSAGVCIPLQPLMNAAWFDERVIGKINGSQAPLFLPVGFALPFIAGKAYDDTGSYMQGFELATVLVIAAAVLALTLYRLPMRDAEASAGA